MSAPWDANYKADCAFCMVHSINGEPPWVVSRVMYVMGEPCFSSTTNTAFSPDLPCTQSVLGWLTLVRRTLGRDGLKSPPIQLQQEHVPPDLQASCFVCTHSCASSSRFHKGQSFWGRADLIFCWLTRWILFRFSVEAFRDGFFSALESPDALPPIPWALNLCTFMFTVSFIGSGKAFVTCCPVHDYGGRW